MKKKILGLILAALIVSAFSSCKDKQIENIPGVEDDGVSTEDERFNNEDPESARFTLMVKDYPISFKEKDGENVYVNGIVRKASVVALDRANSKISKEINGVLKSAYERNNSSGSELMDLVVEAFKDDSFEAETAMFPWYINTNYEVVRNDGLILTVKENVEYFGGGQHTVKDTYYYNFDAQTGAQIPQIMYVEGDDEQRDAADDLIFNKLKAKYGEDVITYDHVISSFVETSIDTWYFTENGIKIHFNHYEIAPYAAGEFEVEIAKDELPESAMQYFLD